MATTEVRTSEIRGAEVDVRKVTDRFGGTDLTAAVLGMFTALGVLVFLGALIAAGNASIPYQLSAIDLDGNLQPVEVVASLVAIAVLFFSFLAGGFVAGRVARYNGGLNGFGAALIFVAVVAMFGALGAWFGSEYNAFAGVDLPNWFGQFDAFFAAEEKSLKVVAAAAAGIVAALLGGHVGGLWGEEFHRRADAAVIQETIDR